MPFKTYQEPPRADLQVECGVGRGGYEKKPPHTLTRLGC
jgi:hypothetical protein